MKITLVLHNIRSTYNVGAILRSADGFGVTQVILSGYTPRVNDARALPHLREKLNAAIAKTALGAEKTLSIENVNDVLTKLKELRAEGWKVLGLENNIADERLVRLDEVRGKLSDDTNLVLVLGEEVDGIGAELYPLIDIFAEIPMRGQKESFNVSVAAGIALYALTN